MKLISARDAFQKGLEMFGEDGPHLIIAPMGNQADLMNRVIEPGQTFSHNGDGVTAEKVLFMGDVTGFGADTRDIVHRFISRGFKSLRGRQEAIVLSIIDAASENRAEKVAAMAAVWTRWMDASAILTSYLNGRDLFDLSNGTFRSVQEMLHDAGNGDVDPGKFSSCIRSIIGEDVIVWMRSLPVVLIFAENQVPQYCNHILVLSHGSLDPDVVKDVRMVTDENAVWSEHQAMGATRSGEILYTIFGNKVPPENIKKATPMVFDNKTGAYKPVTGFQALPDAMDTARVLMVGRSIFQGGSMGIRFNNKKISEWASRRMEMQFPKGLLGEK